MVVYEFEQRWQILSHYFENHGNIVCANVNSLCSLSCEKSETGILIDKSKCEKPMTVHTPKNIAAMAESVHEATSTSIHRRPQQLNISKTSLRRILHKDLGITLYGGRRSHYQPQS